MSAIYTMGKHIGVLFSSGKNTDACHLHNGGKYEGIYGFLSAFCVDLTLINSLIL